MLYAAFSTLAEAHSHRFTHGGWIFVPTDDSDVIWFSLKYTAQAAIVHRAHAGKCGKLV